MLAINEDRWAGLMLFFGVLGFFLGQQLLPTILLTTAIIALFM